MAFSYTQTILGILCCRNEKKFKEKTTIFNSYISNVKHIHNHFEYIAISYFSFMNINLKECKNTGWFTLSIYRHKIKMCSVCSCGNGQSEMKSSNLWGIQKIQQIYPLIFSSINGINALSYWQTHAHAHWMMTEKSVVINNIHLFLFHYHTAVYTRCFSFSRRTHFKTSMYWWHLIVCA